MRAATSTIRRRLRRATTDLKRRQSQLASRTAKRNERNSYRRLTFPASRTAFSDARTNAQKKPANIWHLHAIDVLRLSDLPVVVLAIEFRHFQTDAKKAYLFESKSGARERNLGAVHPNAKPLPSQAVRTNARAKTNTNATRIERRSSVPEIALGEALEQVRERIECVVVARISLHQQPNGAREVRQNQITRGFVVRLLRRRRCVN